MQQSSYKTIETPCEGLFKDKGSKFFAFAYPIDTAAQAKPLIDSLRKEHHGARHLCWAYKLGYSGSEYRTNDDGEPANTAGKPILGQIDAFGLTNILLCVVRYFGGTLLGVGGLIQAYKEAAREALSAAHIVERSIEKHFTINCKYSLQTTVNQILKQHNARVISQSFNQSCRLTCAIPITHAESFLASITNYQLQITNGKGEDIHKQNQDCHCEQREAIYTE
ncbi:MAG: IMPACT family protein [Bacteroidales bacterium]|jgi:uncharacterized YigZ family protein|nr:IMPACT family protein [Bacteroidales bacterium]